MIYRKNLHKFVILLMTLESDTSDKDVNSRLEHESQLAIKNVKANYMKHDNHHFREQSGEVRCR